MDDDAAVDPLLAGDDDELDLDALDEAFDGDDEIAEDAE